MKDTIKLLEYLQKYYYEPLGLILQNVFVMWIALNKVDFFNIRLFSFEINDIKNSILFCVVCFTMILVNIIWLILNFKKPKRDSSKNTILFCISANKYSDYKYIKNILEIRVKNEIEQNLELNIQVLFTKYLASKFVLKKHINSKGFYFLNNNYNLLFICKVVNEWKDKSIPIAELTSDMGVITSRISMETQKLFMNNMSQLIEKYIIKANDDYNDGLDFSKEVILILEYISVIASLLSNNPFYSLKAIEDLGDKFAYCDSNRKSIIFIKSKYQFTYEQILINCALNEYNKYLNDKISSTYDLDLYLGKMKECKNIYYDYLLLKSAVIMLETRNSSLARELIMKAKNTKHKEDVWKLSIAFLDCYDGALIDSYLNYKSAFLIDYQDFLGIEHYISKIYAIEKSKYQLNFALGLLNDFIKEDFIVAREHYNKFIGIATLKNEYLEATSVAKKRLLIINKKNFT